MLGQLTMISTRTGLSYRLPYSLHHLVKLRLFRSPDLHVQPAFVNKRHQIAKNTDKLQNALHDKIFSKSRHIHREDFDSYV